MKKNLLTIITLLILLTSCILIFQYSKIVTTSVFFSISLWKDNIIPSLFPLFILSEFLINYGFITFLGNILKRFMNTCFHLKGETSFVIIGSLITGSPSSAKYIKDLLDKNIITNKEAEYLLTFTHFSNPIFIIEIVGNLLLNNKKLGIIIYLVHITSNIINILIFRPKNKYLKTKESITKTLNQISKNNDSQSFITVLTNAIYKTINTLFLVLGIVTFFVILTQLLCQIFNIDAFITSYLSGLLEITQGIKNVSLLNTSLYIKTILIIFFISFGGFSIHMQVFSILSNYKLKYKYYLFARLLQAFTSITLISLFFI